MVVSLCHNQIYLIFPSPSLRLYNLVMIISRWQSIFCNLSFIMLAMNDPPNYSAPLLPKVITDL